MRIALPRPDGVGVREYRRRKVQRAGIRQIGTSDTHRFHQGFLRFLPGGAVMSQLQSIDVKKQHIVDIDEVEARIPV